LSGPQHPLRGTSSIPLILFSTHLESQPDLPHVLHGINFQVLPGEKVFFILVFFLSQLNKSQIGIVGRTGSGKSTLALSFFRFVEASKGQLFIDDIDIATLGLTDLRRNLTIIPRTLNKCFVVNVDAYQLCRGSDPIERNLAVDSGCRWRTSGC
jgi:ABC-type multidrug transport system fused ATPase/permease subunit